MKLIDAKCSGRGDGKLVKSLDAGDNGMYLCRNNGGTELWLVLIVAGKVKDAAICLKGKYYKAGQIYNISTNHDFTIIRKIEEIKFK